MYWCTIKENYIKYLKQFEQRIPNINYGKDKLKPFFAPLFKTDGLVYLTQITSPKPRHEKMKNQMDFVKYFSDKGKLLGAVNLNYMFPVPPEAIIPLTSNNIDTYRTFTSEKEKSQYIKFLQIQMQSIEKLNIDERAIKLYKHCQAKPNDRISLRCFDYTMLEQKCHEYRQSHQQKPSIKPPVK